jgi:hypothetical protein
MRLSLVEESAA